MLRSLIALALGFSIVTLAGVSPSIADEKKTDMKPLEGKMVCGKCKLKETDACSNVLIVKVKDVEVKYYLTDKGQKETYHKCSGEAAVKVTGKVVEKDKKKTIEDAKVEAVK